MHREAHVTDTGTRWPRQAADQAQRRAPNECGVWYPLSSGTIAQDQFGAFQDVNSYCHLSAAGNVELSIYATTQAASSSPDQLAKHVCVSEEAKGWTPHVSTQS